MTVEPDQPPFVLARLDMQCNLSPVRAGTGVLITAMKRLPSLLVPCR